MLGHLARHLGVAADSPVLDTAVETASKRSTGVAAWARRCRGE